jgi:thiamine transport system permease protein
VDRTLRGDGPAVSLRSRNWLALPPLAFLGLFFAWPLGQVLARGLGSDAGVPAGALSRVIADPYLQQVLWFTAWQAVLSTVLTLAVGLPVAAVLTHLEFPGRRLVEATLMVPFVLPTVVVGTAFVALLGWLAPVVDLRRSVAAILLAHVFFNVAVVVRSVGGLWQHLDVEPVLAARTLGATRWQAFRSVTLPRLQPSITASAAIVFLFTFTSFGVVLILGGPGRSTIEVEIHRATAQLLDLRTAAALSIIQLLAVLATLAVYGRVRTRSARQRLRPAGRERHRPRTVGERTMVAAMLVALAGLHGAPLAALLVRSLRVGERFGLDHYRALTGTTRETVLAVAPATAVRNSLLFALAATVIALVVGTLASLAAVGGGRMTRVVDGALMLPLGTSAVTLGLGLLLAFRSGPFAGRGTLLLVPVAQALVATPFVVRTLLPVLRGIDGRLREAAATLGASPRRVWREIDLPIVARAGTVAAGFAFAVTVGEFGATIFVARASHPTIPVAIYRALALPGQVNLGRAMALSVLLALLTASVVLALDRTRLGRIGRF